MFSVMTVELGFGIAGFLAVSSSYPYGVREEGAAVCVLISVFILVSWMMTIVFFTRKSARIRAARLVNDATLQAAKILSEATDKSLALCSLDAGRCRSCGNPRTGKFCPKCGTPAQPAA